MVKTLVTAFVILLLGTFGAAHATSFTDLGVVNGGEVIYDSGQNLTWYVLPAVGASNPNPTEVHWATAEGWAGGLTIDGKTGWTLPTTQDSWSGAASGEMGTLFTELGNTDSSFTNKGYFTNINHVGYWTSTTLFPGQSPV